MLDIDERVRWSKDRGILDFWEYTTHADLVACGSNSKGIVVRFKGLLWEKTSIWTMTCLNPPKSGTNWRVCHELMEYSRTPIAPKLSPKARLNKEKERTYCEYHERMNGLYNRAAGKAAEQNKPET